MEPHSFLVEWCVRFLENKDIIRKSVLSVERSKEGYDFTINYKEGKKYFLVKEELENHMVEQLDNKPLGIFTLNNQKNVEFVVANWKKLSEMQNLTMYFVNPFSSYDKAWILHPYVHDKICDKTSLKTGLNSMAEMVEPTSAKTLEKNLKSNPEELAQRNR